MNRFLMICLFMLPSLISNADNVKVQVIGDGTKANQCITIYGTGFEHVLCEGEHVIDIPQHSGIWFKDTGVPLRWTFFADGKRKWHQMVGRMVQPLHLEYNEYKNKRIEARFNNDNQDYDSYYNEPGLVIHLIAD